jgi:hypothetical protein
MLLASFTEKEHDRTIHIKLCNKETGHLGWSALDAAKDIHKFSLDLKIQFTVPEVSTLFAFNKTSRRCVINRWQWL